MKNTHAIRSTAAHFTLVICVAFVALMLAPSSVTAQSRGSIGNVFGKKLVDVSLGEITLERIDFRDQTAELSLGLDVTNALLPVQIKDFGYSLRLFDNELIEGTYDGTMRVGGSRRPTRVALPLKVHLRTIPSTFWSAFRNRGRVRYDLDTAFTIPLYVTERRFDQSFGGEVPLRSVVDAATILRAQRTSGASDTNSRIGNIFGLPWE